MSDLDISRLQNRAHAKGYAAGLAAAREAVLAKYEFPYDEDDDYHVDEPTYIYVREGTSKFLAAIDALKDVPPADKSHAEKYPEECPTCGHSLSVHVLDGWCNDTDCIYDQEPCAIDALRGQEASHE